MIAQGLDRFWNKTKYESWNYVDSRNSEIEILEKSLSEISSSWESVIDYLPLTKFYLDNYIHDKCSGIKPHLISYVE